MRATSRRGFTLAELSVSIVSAAMLIGMVAMAMRISMQSRNQHSDQVNTVAEGREALDTIERLVGRAVELTDWDANANEPALASATTEPGDSYYVSKNGTQNLGGGAVNFKVGDVITRDATRFNVMMHDLNAAVSWYTNLNSNVDAAFPGAQVGDVARVTNTAIAPPWTGTTPAPPAGGWVANDLVIKNGPGSWSMIGWRADTDVPHVDDTLGALGAIHVVTRSTPPGAPRDLGSGPMNFAADDVIVKTPAGWRKIAWQNAIRNFKNPATSAEDGINGIQFYADVDPDTTPPSNADLTFGAKRLEWVWIWWDPAQDVDQTARPYERRGPVKVAIFRRRPYGLGANTHDTWSRPSHAFYRRVNAPANNGRKAYFTTASNFGTLQMKIQSFTVPNKGGAGVTWRKRLAITGGVFLDRTGELAALGTNPWDDVAPGSKYIAGAPARFTQTPSYSFSRAIYLDNASAVADAYGRPFTYQTPSRNYNRIINNSAGWQTQYTTGNVKNDYVVQPR